MRKDYKYDLILPISHMHQERNDTSYIFFLNIHFIQNDCFQQKKNAL